MKEIVLCLLQEILGKPNIGGLFAAVGQRGTTHGQIACTGHFQIFKSKL
jgi:hypothetical protein